MTTYTYNDLCELMREHGVYGYNEGSDVDYVSPMKKYILGEFVDYLRFDLETKGILDWFPEGGDCDDFGLWCWSFASQRNAAMRKHAGITVGMFKFIQAHSGEGHAVGFAAHLKTRRLTFLDRVRRNGRTEICEVRLSKSELSSCLSWFV